jgi:uncharacterized protein
MNLLILGATGRIGRTILTLALQDGHHTTAFVRDPQKLNLQHPNLSVFQGNARTKSDIHQAMAGADIVISALSTDGGTTLTESILHVIEEMKLRKLKRIITVGTAGILQSRTDPSLFRFQSSESRRTNTMAAKEHAEVYRLLAQSNLDWTIVCPTQLKSKELKGICRCEPNFLPEGGTEISFSDAAQFTYQQIDSTEFVKVRVGIAY